MIRTVELTRRPGILLLLAGLAAAAIGLDGCALATQQAPPSPRDSLLAKSLLEEVGADYWQHVQRGRPELAAQAGRLVAGLPDPTLDRAKKDAQFARAALAALDAIAVEALSEDDYVSWLTLRWENEALGSWAAFHWTRMNDLAPGRSVLDRSIEILQSQEIHDADNAGLYLVLLRSVSALCRTVRVEFAERISRGVRMPRVSLVRATEHVRSLIAAPEESPFGLTEALPASPDTVWQSRFIREVSDLIVTDVNPALDSLARFLELEWDRSPADIGLGRYPGGVEHYANLLRVHSTLDVTAEDAHTIGLRDVARLAARAAEARRAAGLPADRDSLRAAISSNPELAVPDLSAVPELTARWFATFSRTMDTLFRPTPTVRLSIALIPAAVEDLAPLTTYDPPTVRRDARFRINGRRLASRTAVILPAIVLADLMPGLHRQQSAQRENEALPAFRRLGFHDGFVNGWRMYVLSVADSAGSLLTPAQRYGVRLRELAVACGLVIDTGIHAIGWTREDALRFLRVYLPDDDAELEREFIVESLEAPGVLAAAALGGRELHGLRRWAERELGARFELTAFHHEVLRIGSVPLPVLGSHLERWIWERKSAPVETPR